MRVFSAKETAQLLPYPELATAIGTYLALRRDGKVHVPERIAVPLNEGGVLLAMPATDERIAMTKLVTVHPNNSTHNLPTIQGEVVVMDATTGVRHGILDGATVTGRRTAALSLLAANMLAPNNHGPLLVVGSGTQAHTHVEAFIAGQGVTEVICCSRTQANAEKLAEFARSLGAKASVVATPEEARGQATLIATTTTATKPVINWALDDGVFLAAVGAFTPQMTELSPATLGSANLVVVDTLESIQTEAGDFLNAVAAGALLWSTVHELDQYLTPATHNGAVIFKSVGHALFDLAAAHAAFPPQ